MRDTAECIAYIDEVLGPQITVFADSLERRLLRSFDDLTTECEEAEARYAKLREQVFAEDPYVDPASEAEAVRDFGVEHYRMLERTKAGMVNLWAAGLFHLFEQHVGFFIRECFDPAWNGKGPLPKCRDKLSITVDISTLPSWSTIEELQLVANCVKHAEGSACGDLRKRVPSLFVSPSARRIGLRTGLAIRRQTYFPLAGEDFFLRPEELPRYATAIRTFWKELWMKFPD